MIVSWWSKNSLNIILNSVALVLEQLKMKTCLMLRRNFCYGIVDGEWGCIAYRSWWRHNKSRSPMGPSMLWGQSFSQILLHQQSVQCRVISYWIYPIKYSQTGTAHFADVEKFGWMIGPITCLVPLGSSTCCGVISSCMWCILIPPLQCHNRSSFWALDRFSFSVVPTQGPQNWV